MDSPSHILVHPCKPLTVPLLSPSLHYSLRTEKWVESFHEREGAEPPAAAAFVSIQTPGAKGRAEGKAAGKGGVQLAWQAGASALKGSEAASEGAGSKGKSSGSPSQSQGDGASEMEDGASRAGSEHDEDLTSDWR